jgi:hypothetical protein
VSTIVNPGSNQQHDLRDHAEKDVYFFRFGGKAAKTKEKDVTLPCCPSPACAHCTANLFNIGACISGTFLAEL